MIRLNDAFLLARTKLKLRIVRLTITIIISSLLFGVLVFISLIFAGSTASLQSFGKEGFGGRYLVQANPITYNVFGDTDDLLIKYFEPIQSNLISQKKVSAKKLNINYDSSSDQSLPLLENKQPNGIIEKYFNPSSPYISDYVSTQNSSKGEISFSNFQAIAFSSGSVNVFRGTKDNNSGYGFPNISKSSVQVLVNGKEESLSVNNSYVGGPPTGLASITALGWSQFDSDLLTPFVLAGQSLKVGEDGSIPIIAPMSAASEILGIKALPATASPAEKLQRIIDVRSGVAGKSATICYRNSASANLLQIAQDQQESILQNKGKSDFVMPSLLYKLPELPCGPVTVQKDTRTSEEKLQANNDELFKKQFNEQAEPDQGTVTVRVVGITTEYDYNASFSAASVAQSILQSSLGTGWFSPTPAIVSNEIAIKALDGGDFNKINPDRLMYFAEFSTLESAKQFIKKYSCDSYNSSMMSGPPSIGFDKCVDNGKPFIINPYGNNAGAVEEFRRGFWTVSKYIVLAIVILASLIMMGNVGKIIADSRRETAVFRALGAKRFDIAQIYLTYSLMLAFLLFACSATIGMLGALWFDSWLKPTMSVVAVLTYNAADTSKQFWLFGFDIKLFIGVFGLIVLAAFASTIIPLSGNLTRNPIKDMRDEG